MENTMYRIGKNIQKNSLPEQRRGASEHNV